MKSRIQVDGNGVKHLVYKCPGCKHTHSVPAERWHWNGSMESPTLSPSVRHFIPHEDGRQETVCHYFVINGQIQFCGDCPHEFSGKTVDLPEIGEVIQ